MLKEGASHATCLPVQTYSLDGVAKPSVVKSHHSIIYSRSRAPKPKSDELPRGEEEGMLRAIRVVARSRSEHLDPMSRLNYDKVYTVEHNIKVYEFGDIHREHLKRFLRNWRKVWRDVQEEDENDVDSDDSESGSEEEAEEADPEVDPMVMAQHNVLVARYVHQWRSNGTEEDIDRAEYLLHATYQEQVNYLRSCGAYRHEPQRSEPLRNESLLRSEPRRR